MSRCKKCDYYGKFCNFSEIRGVTKLKLGQKVGEPCKFFSPKGTLAEKRRCTDDNEKRNELIKKMFAIGKTDVEIANALDCSTFRVPQLRKRLGLVRNARKSIVVDVFSEETGEMLCEGTISECADKLGESQKSLERALSGGSRRSAYRFEVVG